MKRSEGRAYNQLRKVTISYNAFGYAAGSVLFGLGKTKVLCTVTLQPNVPSFLKGKKMGWLTAEYAMLPTATTVRTVRDSCSVKKNGRAIEISRLIGRSLRSTVDLTTIGERTIFVDCDVLQADGGTRAACVTGSFLALEVAQKRWLEHELIKNPILTNAVAAISVGVKDGKPLLDLDFNEDSSIDADFNFVLTRSGAIIEMQGAAEASPVSWEQFEAMRTLAQQGVDELFTIVSSYSEEKKELFDHHIKKKTPLFSLQNR